MAVSSQDVVAGPFTADGSTTAFPFEIQGISEDEVVVWEDGEAISSSLYTVTLSDTGGTVNYTTAPAADVEILIVSDPSFASSLGITDNGPFNPSVVEDALDRGVARDLLIKAMLDSITPPDWHTPSRRASKFAGYDADGNPTYLSGTGNDPDFRADVAENADALIRLGDGRLLGDAFGALPDLFRRGAFSFTSGKGYGDSFADEPNIHTDGDSIVGKYFDLLGVSYTISAASGATTADRQTTIMAATVAATDHNVILLGQNDASRVGTGDQRTKYGDLARTYLACMVWLGKAAGTNKVAAGTTDSGQREVSDPAHWSADADMTGAFKTTTSGAAMSFTLTGCRYAVLLYKAKVSSTGIMQVKCEGADEQIQEFRTAPESAWVPTNGSQTWAIFARVFDFGAVVPSGVLQMTTSGTGEVSLVGCVGFSGDPLTGPLLGVSDVSRRGVAGNATAAGSQSNVPIVNRIWGLALAQAQALGINAIDLPLASVLDPATDLDTDEFHPSESGASKAAAAWAARVVLAQGMAGNRPDLLVQGLIQNPGGELAAGMPLMLDAAMRMRFGRIGGSGIDLTGDRNVRHTSGLYLVPIISGVPDATKALILTGDGTNSYLQSLVGDLILKAATGNGYDFGATYFRPVDDNNFDSGGAANQWKRVYVGPGGVLASGTKVVGIQGAAVADAAGGATIDAEARTALNALLARLRTHGLIAT